MKIEGFLDVGALLQAGIYILTWREEVVYVGQSKSLYSRIYSHRYYWNKARGKPRRLSTVPWMVDEVKAMKFDSVHIKSCAIGDLDRVERELIQKYNPRYNSNHKPKVESISVVVNGFRLRVKAPVPKFERRV